VIGGLSPKRLKGTTMAKTFAWLYGIGFLALSAIWFLQNSEMVLGLFHVDKMHNMVHVLSGILGIGAAISGEWWSLMYMRFVAIGYGLVAILGFITPNVMGMHMNMADNFLHIGLAAIAAIPALRGLTHRTIAPAQPVRR
jgi:hypothetical protein